MNWHAQGACHGHTDLFFPPVNERRPAREARQQAALALCDSCPVFDQCATYAQTQVARDAKYFSGIWAGRIYHDQAEQTRQRGVAVRRAAKTPSTHPKAQQARQYRARLKTQLDAARAAKDVA